MARKIATVTAEVTLTVECDECGAELSARGDDTTVYVEPCPTCLKVAHDEADNAGFDRGLEEGRAKGGA